MMSTGINLVIVTVIATTLLISSTIIPIGLAKAQRNPTGITPPISGQFSLGPLTDRYWNWLFGLNVDVLGGNPFTDTTGAFACKAGLQKNGMFFLGGTIGTVTEAGAELPPSQSL